MPNRKKPYVFVCYSHHDHQFASDFSKRLHEAGISHFLDENDIPWGQSIPDVVHSALEDTTDLVVLISPDSLQSQWVAYEVGFARGKKANLVPYLLGRNVDLPGFLGNIKYLKDRNAELSWTQSLLSSERTSIRTKAPVVPDGGETERIRTLKEGQQKIRSKVPELRQDGVRILIELKGHDLCHETP